MKKVPLKQLVINFNKGYVNRRTIINALTPLIMEIPGYLKVFDEDLIQSFYAVIIGDIDKIIRKFSPMEGCGFEAWFARVLRWKFVEIIRKESKKKELIEEIEFNDENQYTFSEEKMDINNKNLDLSKFSKMEKKIILLKYLSTRESAANHDYLVDKIFKKRQLDDKLEWSYMKIIKLQKNIQKAKEEKKDHILSNLQEKEKKSIRNKRKTEHQYYNYRICHSNLWVAEKLNVTGGTISSCTNRIRSKIKKEYQEFLK